MNLHIPTPTPLLIFDRRPFPRYKFLSLPQPSKMAPIIFVQKTLSTRSPKLRLEFMFVKVTNSHLWKTSCNGNISIAGIITILVAASQVFLWFATSIFRNILLKGFIGLDLNTWFKQCTSPRVQLRTVILSHSFCCWALWDKVKKNVSEKRTKWTKRVRSLARPFCQPRLGSCVLYYHFQKRDCDDYNRKERDCQDYNR